MSKPNQNIPELSVIIPTRNRADVLSRVLNALNDQTCAFDLYEIVIVDDGSEDNTIDLVRDFSRQSRLPVRYVRQVKLGPGAARNLGIAKARSKLILFLDADLVPEPEVVFRHLSFHRQNQDHNSCLLGAVKMALELDIPEQVRKHETELGVDGNALQGISPWQFRTGNASMPKRLLQNLNGFDVRFEAAEDTELGYRLSLAGARFFYDPAIIVYHYHPMNLNRLIKKQTAYGRAAALWYCECPDVRTKMSERYGVYVSEMSWTRKMKYCCRCFFVNRFSIVIISKLSEKLKYISQALTRILQKQLVQYYCRISFRSTLRNMMFSSRKLHYSVTKRVCLT